MKPRLLERVDRGVLADRGGSAERTMVSAVSRKGQECGVASSAGATELRMTVRVGSVETNGIRTHYWEVGSGPPLVFLHGLGFDLTQWRPQLRFFASCYRVVCYDLRAHGASGGGERRFDFIDWIHDLRALLKALEIEKPTLCGHGLGGEVALHYAIAFPREVGALVVADAPSPRRRVINRLGLLAKRVLLVGSRVLSPLSPLAPLARWTQWRIYGRAFRRDDGDEMASFRRSFRSLSIGAWLRASAAEAKRPDHGGQLSRIEGPVLLIRGTQDRLLPLREAFRCRRQIPGSQLHHVRGAGHMVPRERSDEFNDLVDRFLLGELGETPSRPIRAYELGPWRLASATALGALAFGGVLSAAGGGSARGLIAEPGVMVAVVAACLGYAVAWPLVFARVRVSGIIGWLLYGLAAAFTSILLVPPSVPLEFLSPWHRLAAFLAMSAVFGWIFSTHRVAEP